MGITFSKQSPPAQEQFAPIDLSSIERRVRTIEQSHTNLRKIVQVTEENILVKNRHSATEFKALTSDINELRRELHEMRDKMALVLKEMQSLARQDDVKVLERYISMWNPIKFVTQGEVESIVSEAMGRKQLKAPEKDEEQ